ncbi:nucleoside hydrolase [Sporolactobacillus sp. THM7-4]|nr:nucleoside hydrolase [Sporolactobacillus sp. THM7-4]
MTKKKILLDVDTGVDDALALILATQSRAFHILGITVTSGNVSLDQAFLNTNKVIQWLNLDKSIPILRGSEKPLRRHPLYEHRVHGNDGLGGALADQPVQLPDGGDAVDFLIQTIEEHPRELTLIMTAPLTNLARALMKKPGIAALVKETVIMGGVVQGYGNITPVAEFNMYVDPEAAKIVFHSGLPITLVGLDVTRKARLNEKHLADLDDSRFGSFVRQATAQYFAVSEKRTGVRACALHDPLAVGVALDPSLVEKRAYYVDVETNSDLCDGQTVCDFQNRWGKAPNIQVCTDVQSERFLNLFMKTLKGE